MKTYLENESLIDNKTGLMRIPLMCDRCKKSEEVLYRDSRQSVRSSRGLCKNCADEYKKMREEFKADREENLKFIREISNLKREREKAWWI